MAIQLDKKAIKAYWRRGMARRELGQKKEALEGSVFIILISAGFMG